MTYLATPRVVCCGRFLSDVSTRNNVPGNFDSGIAQITDLWNNLGGATFELLDCRVTGGSALGDQDPATGYILTDAADRPSAKMVDLDPAWQMASEIWALALRLIDPQTQELAFAGDFEVASFRDLYTRQVKEVRAGMCSTTGSALRLLPSLADSIAPV